MKIRSAVHTVLLTAVLGAAAPVRPSLSLETAAASVIERLKAPEAVQGVAVDKHHFHAIDSRAIGKYERTTGRLVKRWEEDKGGPILHLDSGVVVRGRLYCAHSNYPKLPMTSSVEILDAESLEHVGSHSFGVRWGSCTWIDRHNGAWWAAFAPYDQFKEATGKDASWSTLVEFDSNWRARQSWVYPEALVERFRPMSNSGGSWGPDGLLYLTGHDAAEVYAVRLPRRGSALEHVRTVPLAIEGQGIAWDRRRQGVLVGIRRSAREVVAFEVAP